MADLTSYTLSKDHWGVPARTILFRCKLPDYGCASDDMRSSGGEEHWSMTRDPDGGYPFIIIPRRLLTENSVAVTETVIAQSAKAQPHD